MAFTRNFVFTDPVAAQQAVQYAQLANQEQAQADQAFNDRIRTGTQGRISQQNAQQQMMLNQSQLAQRSAEAEKDRELARQGYVNAQTVAGITAGPRDDAIKARQAADMAANKMFLEENFNRGTSFARTLNDPATPQTLKQKLMQSGDVEMGPDGFWRSRHVNPNQAESIDDIRGRMHTVPVPGTVVEPGRWFGSNPIAGGVVGSKIPASMDSMPSRSRMLQMGPPRFADFPSAPAGPSPFETPGFRVFRQSDIINQTVPVPEVPVDQPWMQPAY